VQKHFADSSLPPFITEQKSSRRGLDGGSMRRSGISAA